MYKIQYPISTDQVLVELRKAIIVQKDYAENTRKKCDYYKIVDPIYGHYHLQIRYLLKLILGLIRIHKEILKL
jgi:hypothetical protein